MNTLNAAIEALRQGRMVVLTDDALRENEGDLCMAASHIQAEHINFMVWHGGGLICLALPGCRVDALGIPMMVQHNESRLRTGFTVSIEARNGVTTGISAFDRAHTIRVASSPHSGPQDIVQPGHIFPLRAASGGVLSRFGHTEGSLALMDLAHMSPAAVICEIMAPSGHMLRGEALFAFAEKHHLPVLTMVDVLLAYAASRSLIGSIETHHWPNGVFYRWFCPNTAREYQAWQQLPRSGCPRVQARYIQAQDNTSTRWESGVELSVWRVSSPEQDNSCGIWLDTLVLRAFLQHLGWSRVTCAMEHDGRIAQVNLSTQELPCSIWIKST
jgi:3,4-dihydroxy-2-butanone 4-phosphate synthase